MFNGNFLTVFRKKVIGATNYQLQFSKVIQLRLGISNSNYTSLPHSVAYCCQQLLFWNRLYYSWGSSDSGWVWM